MKPLELQLKEILGAKEYNRFADTVIFPAIQQLAENGKLSNSDLAKLAKLTRTYGAGIFDVAATDVGEATKHNLSDGFSIIAKYKLNDDLEFKLFVKKFSDGKSFHRGVTIQEMLAKSLKGTELEGTVPDQVYSNSGKRIVMMPLVEAKPLSMALLESDKEELLRKTIDEYLKISDHVESKKVFVPPKRNAFGKIWYEDFNLPSLQDFNKFFVKNFGADAELAENYKKNIGGRLDGNTTDFVHGDLHPGNILINGKTHFIDWELGANGFVEFDLYKLFTKSGVSGELEERLLAYTVVTKEKLRAKRENRYPASADTHRLLFEASKTRYRLNQITQDLLAAERYSKHSQRDAKLKSRLENMAVTAYNIGLRHIEKAEEEGILSSDFRLALERFVDRNKKYGRVDNLIFAELLKEYNPHTTASQDNLVSHGTELNVTIADRESRQKNLKVIRKSLRKKDWPKIGKIAAAAVFVLGSAGFAGFKQYEQVREKETTKLKAIQENIDQLYNLRFKTPYEKLIEAKLGGGWRESRYDSRRTAFEGFDIINQDDNDFLKTVAADHNLPCLMLYGMIKGNALAADAERNGATWRGLNFLDVYQIEYLNNEGLNVELPKDNIEFGAKRLSKLLEKYKVNRNEVHEYYEGFFVPFTKVPPNGLTEALTEFYVLDKHDEIINKYDYEEQKRKLNGMWPSLARKLVWNALRGGPTGDDMTGIPYLDFVPNDFKLK